VCLCVVCVGTRARVMRRVCRLCLACWSRLFLPRVSAHGPNDLISQLRSLWRRAETAARASPLPSFVPFADRRSASRRRCGILDLRLCTALRSSTLGVTRRRLSAGSCWIKVGAVSLVVTHTVLTLAQLPPGDSDGNTEGAERQQSSESHLWSAGWCQGTVL